MRILIVNDYGTPGGGAEHMSLALRDGLRRRGHEARLFTSSARHAGLDNIADDLCFGSEGPARRLIQMVNPSAAVRLRRVMSRFGPDVVHVRMFLTQLSPAILPLLYGRPSLLHVVNYQPICPINTKTLPDGTPCYQPPGFVCYQEGCVPLAGVARAYVQLGLWNRWRGAFDILVANSEWTGRRLRREGLEVGEVIWNGVPDASPRAPLSGPPTVAYAGRLVAKKGVDVLLEAMRDVVARVPDARLIVAGEGPERGSLEQQMRALGLAGHVAFLGHHPRSRAEALLAPAWVQAVPSRWEEPFGLVAAEAMMRGTAVVASAAGGLTEQVIDNVTGFLVPRGDAGALAAALLNVLEDRGRAEAMGARGREMALARFREDATLDRFEDLYRRLCHACPH